MREPIVHNQRDFERWLVDETSVFARMDRAIEAGTSPQTGAGAEMTRSHYTALITVLSRYTDRDSMLLASAASDRKALMEVIRTGPSMLAQAEAMAEAAENADYRCRGCGGTCCTGIGSEPCTCPPSGSGDEND